MFHLFKDFQRGFLVSPSSMFRNLPASWLIKVFLLCLVKPGSWLTSKLFKASPGFLPEQPLLFAGPSGCFGFVSFVSSSDFYWFNKLFFSPSGCLISAFILNLCLPFHHLLRQVIVFLTMTNGTFRMFESIQFFCLFVLFVAFRTKLWYNLTNLYILPVSFIALTVSM